MKFDEILSILSNLDEAGLPLDGLVEMSKPIVGELKEKVDAIAIVQERLELEIARLASHAHEFDVAAKAAEKRLESLNNWVMMTMEAFGYDRCPGNNYKIVLRQNPISVIITEKPTPQDYEDYPECVTLEQKYKWRLTEIKSMIADGIPFKDAKLERTKRLVVDINKT